MRIISIKKLREFFESYPDSEQAIKSWKKVAKAADWSSCNEIKQQYRNASIVGNNRVVFNICGNKYRLIVKISFKAQIIYVRFIGTHKAYDGVNAKTI